MKKEIANKISDLEKEYITIFYSNPRTISSDETSLEQPSPLKIVPSVGTSDAYQEPLKLDMEVSNAELG